MYEDFFPQFHSNIALFPTLDGPGPRNQRVKKSLRKPRFLKDFVIWSTFTRVLVVMWTNQHDTMLISLYQVDLYWNADFDDIIVLKCFKLYKILGYRYATCNTCYLTQYKFGPHGSPGQRLMYHYFFRGSCFSIYSSTPWY